MTTRLLSRCALALASLLPLGLASPVQAQSQIGRFEGGGVIYNFNTGCRNVGWTVSMQSAWVRYRPRRMGNNGDAEAISFFTPFWSVSLVRWNGPFGTSLTDVDSGGTFGTPFYNQAGSTNGSQVRILIRSPSTLTPTLATPVRLRGQIRNWGGAVGCNVLFEATLGQKL